MFHPKGPTLTELARQALSSTTRGYDLLAPKFEYTPFRTPDELIEPLARAAATEPFATALDCCCGTGAIARALRLYATERVTGIDVSEGMLAEARGLAAAGPTEASAELEFVNADVMTMSYEEEFDVIATAGAFGHILQPDQDRFLDNIWRALTPGGRFFFITGAMPRPTTSTWWIARGFNAVMHVRNALIDPPFVMFYLTFTLERAVRLCEEKGFEVDTLAPGGGDPVREVIVAARKPW